MSFGFRKWRKHRPSFCWLFIFCAVSILAPIQSAHARKLDNAHAGTIALLQSSQRLRIGVVGDSMAGDLGDGMQKLLRDHDTLKVIRFAKPATGLMRDDVYNWQSALKAFISKTKLNAIVVMIGGNDRQSIWLNGRRLPRGSKMWLTEYERRVARFMTTLAAVDAKVYWVGLPAVRSAWMSRDYQGLNRIFRAQARKHGFTYVSTWEHFLDESGGYTSFGHSLDGVKRRLRKEDGMHFTNDGQLRLADIVAGAIGRDLSEIKTAR
ncbi:SGNH/GDSL hydrolase family protein [Pseudorhodoplanes sinuspersici]|uniref:Uncharacterized protein n=1 Tax=Pseudorhodoplanes sinuspersici TaxID=1235591 RepID=A0A1W6ZMC9_9HYPH|nr:DUF459 domain-containing protein [Pseudorhodoplanes sinuspersici]ARP98521.1 hypothetical protein CAK95_05035 [Pseudorhodoplanes sinuspersici]RKE65888.1 uncharacterized protein DUF459 [Pseudorhodoplanes sinuspersici]